MRIVLHIGLEKTGTTSIQAYCQRHAPALKAQGVLYPSGLGPGNHANLVTAVAAFDETADMRARAGVRTEADLAAFGKRAVGSLRRQVARARPRCLLLSNEHFSSRCDAEAAKRLRDILDELSDDVRVLIYLRRQDQLLVSLYSTYLEAAGTRDISQLGATIPWFDFDAVLGRWADVFGRDRLDVRRFPPLQGSLIEDFAAAAGLPGLPVAAGKAHANRSLDQRNAALLERINAIRPTLRDETRESDPTGLFRFMQARSSGSGLTMPRGEREAFLARFTAGNEAVRAAYFPEEQTLFAPVAEDDALPPDPTIDDALELAVEIWADRARLAARLDAARRGRLRSRLSRAVRGLRGLS